MSQSLAPEFSFKLNILWDFTNSTGKTAPALTEVDIGARAQYTYTPLFLLRETLRTSGDQDDSEKIRCKTPSSDGDSFPLGNP